MDLLGTIKGLAKQFADDVVECRRHIHANPELSYEEHETAHYVADRLRAYGITNIKSVAKTGVIAEIAGVEPHRKVIALRADLDALAKEGGGMDSRYWHEP